MTEGVDYSDGRPGGAALAAAGKAFAVRYIGHSNPAVNLTTAEIADLHAHNVAVAVVLERGQTRLLGGEPTGRVDGAFAKSELAALGIPADRPVYFAVDFNAGPADQTAINAYLTGAATQLGISRVGVYGSFDVVTRCNRANVADWYWQTIAWSRGLRADFIHLYQWQTGSTGAPHINGAPVDNDRAYQADFGQWPILPDSSTGAAMADIPVLDPAPKLVDIPVGAAVLTPDGGAKILDNSVARTCLSPFASVSPGGTAIRTIVWTRAAPAPDLFRSVYTGAVTVRDIPVPPDTTPFSQADLDKAKADAHAATKAAAVAAVEAI